MTAMRDMMRKLKLTVNEKKTHMCDVPRESFDFLSYTFGRCWSPKPSANFAAMAERLKFPTASWRS